MDNIEEKLKLWRLKYNKKECNKCKEFKYYNQFYRREASRDGYTIWCKDCRKEYQKNYNKKHKKEKINLTPDKKHPKEKYYEKNKEKIKKYRKKYYKKNKEKLLEYSKNYKKENKSKILEYQKKYQNSPLKWDSKSVIVKKISKYGEQIKKSGDGFVEVICAYCGNWFKPTYMMLKNRWLFICGKIISESKFYCSDQCKQECPIYNQILYPKNYKPATSREVQPELRQLVLKRDNYTCQKCYKHKDQLEVGLHCHHIWPLNEDPVKSADQDECITLCKTCHKKVHKVPGCGYNEMKCNKKL